MKRLIYTAASGWYVNYAPLFEYCAKRSYPECDVRVDILDNVPTTFFAACYRLLNTIEGYDRVYINDVDMMLLPLSPTLWEYHEARMKDTGLCYSNSPRTREPQGPQRLTGLHYATAEWYRVTQEQRHTYMQRLVAGKLGRERFDDELSLMRVCRNSGLPIPPPERLVPRHFGIHMGSIRSYENHTPKVLQTQLGMRITEPISTLWNQTIDSDGFVKAAKASCDQSKRIGRQFHQLEMFTRSHSLAKGQKYHLSYA